MSEVITEREILSEMNTLYGEYRRLVVHLNAKYSLLNRMREQLPLKFLNNDNIATFLDSKKKEYNKEVQKVEKKIAATQEKINQAKSKKAENLTTLLKDLELDLRISVITKNTVLKMIETLGESSPQYFYEDLLIFVSNCKHEAIEVYKTAYALLEDLKLNDDYYASTLLIEISDSYLKDKAFNSPTDGLRRGYVQSRKEVKQFRQLKVKAASIEKAAQELMKCYEADEVNLRRFVDRKNKLQGL